MPKLLTSKDLDLVAAAVARVAGGVGINELARQLASTVSRRTLQRRLAALVESGRLVASGAGRALRYAAVTGGAAHQVREPPAAVYGPGGRQAIGAGGRLEASGPGRGHRSATDVASTSMSSQEFGQGIARAKRAARRGPVIVLDRGRPAYVLLQHSAYLRLLDRPPSILEMLHLPGVEDIDFTPPRLGDKLIRLPEFG